MNIVFILSCMVISLWCVDYVFVSGSKKHWHILDRLSANLQVIGTIIVGVTCLFFFLSSFDGSYPSIETQVLSMGLALKLAGAGLFCRLKKVIVLKRRRD